MRKSTLGKVEEAPRLGVLIHDAVRAAIERAVEEELEAALGVAPYARNEGRQGYRNGTRPRSLTGPTGKFAMKVPRATMFTKAGKAEWRSALVPRYARRIAEVNEAVTAAYLSGANTLRGRALHGRPRGDCDGEETTVYLFVCYRRRERRRLHLSRLPSWSERWGPLHRCGWLGLHCLDFHHSTPCRLEPAHRRKR